MHNIETDTFENCGQIFFIINTLRWDKLKQQGSYEGVSFGSKELIEFITGMVDLAENNKGFCCALSKQKLGRVKYYWLAMLFCESEEGLIRVGIENATCTECGWVGVIANPSLPQLYDLIDNKFYLLREIDKLKHLNCPICNSKLSRHAIWIK